MGHVQVANGNFLGDKRSVLWNSASREYAFQECTDLVTLVIMCSLMLSELVIEHLQISLGVGWYCHS